jgi:hypothetical protein
MHAREGGERPGVVTRRALQARGPRRARRHNRENLSAIPSVLGRFSYVGGKPPKGVILGLNPGQHAITARAIHRQPTGCEPVTLSPILRANYSNYIEKKFLIPLH